MLQQTTGIKTFLALAMSASIACAQIPGLGALGGLFGGVGGGIPVIDTTAEANTWTQVLKEIDALQKLDAQIKQLDAQIALMKMAGQFYTSKSAWKGYRNQIYQAWSPNTYGVAAPWSPMVLAGSGNPLQVWQAMTVALRKNQYLATAAGQANNGQFAQALAASAAVDGYDGAGPMALKTIGATRAQMLKQDAVIANLQSEILSTDPNRNTQVSQLNLIAATNAVGLQNQQALVNLETVLAEQQTLANMAQRNQIVDAQNFRTLSLQHLQNEPALPGDNAATVIAAYRMP